VSIGSTTRWVSSGRPSGRKVASRRPEDTHRVKGEGKASRAACRYDRPARRPWWPALRPRPGRSYRHAQIDWKPLARPGYRMNVPETEWDGARGKQGSGSLWSTNVACRATASPVLAVSGVNCVTLRQSVEQVIKPGLICFPTGVVAREIAVVVAVVVVVVFLFSCVLEAGGEYLSGH
jgi:hypothetical protein